MQSACIIQARRGSSRFPDKVMKNILGKPMLYHVIRRVQHCELVSKVILATTNSANDRSLSNIAKCTRTEIFSGSEKDVLDRYYQAAKKFRLDIIVRITADCPLIDPLLVDRVVKKFCQGHFDYVNNFQHATFPEGLSVEVFTINALERAWKEADMMSEREHVTPYIRKNPDKFKSSELTNDVNLSHLRWTVDYKADLEFVRRVYSHLFRINPYFNYHDVLQLLEEYPHLTSINAGIERDEGYKKSIREDRRIQRSRI